MDIRDLQDVSLVIDMNKDNKLLYHFYRYEANGKRIEINAKKLTPEEKKTVKARFAVLLTQVNKTWLEQLG